MLQTVWKLNMAAFEDSLTKVVEQAQGGQMDAFNTLFSTYSTRICTYLARMVGNDEEGRDLAQETFLKAWSMLPEMRDPSRFRPWLYRIATNIAIDYLRARKLRRWLLWAQVDTEGERIKPIRSLQAFDSIAQVAETEHVKQALVCVTPKYRACILLQIEGGFAQREIASLLHLSEKSISIYIQRGSEQFRRAYERLDPEQPASFTRNTSK